MRQRYALPRILWLWIPFLGILIKLIGEKYFYVHHMDWIAEENGPYEILQVLILIPALLTALTILKHMPKDNWLYVGWIALAAICCVYVIGEEISWGQHILNWTTPEFWQGVNDQGETNLHNTSSWLDQKPRLLLSLGVYIGGLIMPVLMFYKPKIIQKQFQILIPSRDFIVTASICLFIKIFDKIGETTGDHILGRNAESEEIFLFYFVFLYLLLMKKRLVPAKQ